MKRITAMLLALMSVAPAGLLGQELLLPTACVGCSVAEKARGSAPRRAEVATPAPTPLALSNLATAVVRTPSQRFAFGESWAERHPIVLGALIGFGVGSAVALVSKACRDSADGESYCGIAVVGYGGLGAGLGAIVGYNIRR